ncbi:hypothetical protein GOBAR_DD12572 [Gossypium barbadense]|nr:hypothetical protein GOBAR_DD12572 [Gossypium barbadense]
MPSALFLKMRSAVRNGIQRTECELQDSLEILIGKGKLGFRNYRFFHSSSLSGLADLQGFFPSGTVLAACSDSLSVNCGRNISAVGAFPRTVFVPSVSGPAFQVCRYHIDCALVDSSQIPPTVSKCQSNPMAVSSSGVVIGGFVDSLKLKHGHLSSSASSADILYGNRSIHPRISLKNLERPNNYAIYGQLLHSIGKRWCNCNLSSGSGSRAFHSSLPSCLSAGTARDVSFDNSGGEEQIFAVPIAPGDVIIAGTDGLFDNLYNNEITAVVVHALRAGFGPEVTAQKIAALARERAQAKDRQTPFSTAAQDAGFRYYGGKLDDITVVVSYVTSSDEASSKKS